METHLDLLQAGIRGSASTIKGSFGLDSNRKGRYLKVQTTSGATIGHHGDAGGSG